MKIAVASDGKQVSGHFGHCSGFMIYEIREDKSLKRSFVENPGHKPGFLPAFLKEKGVNVIISGGMGETAVQLFRDNKIEVVIGAQGLCDDVIQKYINGELKSTGSVCTEHQYEGNCNK
ncbi:NifB/NifX family molybdenum-iron cluster-binding protein [uncultured Clostridium sp.]|uniref:NifB/NifX family molybdenum-iron cluster-binding protein n=1 Tax=uncultured Clostridium sp. TaxID=59620 RepID=UPI0025DE9F9E|nr:NifB/NifX family molybdenum-iron cluster-binding protein [uncultured Clostridium sp.]